MKVKRESESEVAQLCLTLQDPMDCSLPGSSIHGIFQARILEWVAIAFCPGQPGANHCQAAQGVRDGLDLTSFPCVHSTHICCASSKGILCGPHKGLMMRPLMKLFSRGDRTPSSALCAPKDCASVCTRGRNRRGPSSLFIHHPADQTLAPRSGSARPAGQRTSGRRPRIPRLPGSYRLARTFLPFPRPFPSSAQPGASGRPESPRVLHDPSPPPCRAARAPVGTEPALRPRPQATPTDSTVRRPEERLGRPGPESHPGRNPAGTGARLGDGSGPPTASDPAPHVRHPRTPTPPPGLPARDALAHLPRSCDYGDPAHL